MTVAVYARVSTKDKGQDTENQLSQLREFCRRQEWTIQREYIDRKTAKNATGRAEFMRMFADARTRQFDLVLFWSLDRFSREGVLGTLNQLNDLSNAGVAWKSFTEQYLDSCGIFKDAVLSILATMAKQERLRISDRVQAGFTRYREDYAAGRVGKTRHSGACREASKAGAMVCICKPVGKPKLIINRDKIRDMHAAGLSVREIAKQLGASKSFIHQTIQELRTIAA